MRTQTISAANASFCAHHAENLNRTRMFSTPANSGGVDENELPAVALVNNVDGVARGSGQFAHNRALAAHDGVNERGFTHVWPTDDRNRDWMFNVRSAFAEARRTSVRCSMLAGEGSRRSIASNNSEIPRSCSALIENICSKPNESNSAASGSCFSLSILLITSTTGFRDLRSMRASSSSTGDKPSFASTTKSRRSLSRSASSAARRTCSVSSFACAENPAGVPQCERALAASADCRNPVACDSGLIMNNGNFPADKTIEQRGLTYIRPSDNCHIRQRVGLIHRSSSASRVSPDARGLRPATDGRRL